MPLYLEYVQYLLACLLIFLVPGIAWYAWLSNDQVALLNKLAEVVGISIALTALTALLGFYLHLKFNVINIGILYGGLLVVAIIGLLLRPFQIRKNKTLLAGLVIFILMIAWRFYQIRDLVLPAWVDSLHHVLIIRVILDQGILPANLEPYLPVPFYYHFTFHSLAALFSFLANLSPEQAVLILGQVLNSFVALSVYRLGIALWQDKFRALLAALLVAFVTQMPAYYVSWGRYTLVTGMLLLPLAMAVALDMRHEGWNIKRVLSLILITAAVWLTHYIVALVLMLFFLCLGVLTVASEIRARKKVLNSSWLGLIVAAFSGGLLASPWLVRVWSYIRESLGVDLFLSNQTVEQVYFQNYPQYLWQMLGPQQNYLLLGLAVLGLFFTLRRTCSTSLHVWTIALGLLSLPWGLHVSLLRPDHFVIVLFLPVALLAADFLVTCRERLILGKATRFTRLLWWAVIVGLLLFGLRETASVVNPTTILAEKADLTAMDWIKENTPKDARFFIRVVPWQHQIYRGEDAGWWINLITGRQVLLPSTFYILGKRQYVDQINLIAQQASQMKGCTSELRELLNREKLNYIYVGSKTGNLQPESLVNCSYLHLVYSRDGVNIYQVNEETQ